MLTGRAGRSQSGDRWCNLIRAAKPPCKLLLNLASYRLVHHTEIVYTIVVCTAFGQSPYYHMSKRR